MNTNNNCIYRQKYKNKKCNNICINGKKFCYKHCKYKDIGIFEIINEACNNKENILDNENIYNIFKYIFNNYKNDSEELKKKLFIKIIAYLFSLNSLMLFCKKNDHIIKKEDKILIINNIYQLQFKIYKYENDINIHNYIKKIQKFTKIMFFKKLNKSYDNNLINHTTDPFTLENINDIPKINRFYFKEDDKIYCFDAIEFEYYCRTNNTNPFTQKKIDTKIINKLNLFIKYRNLKIKSDDYFIEHNWDTHEQAYTDVVHYMEKLGFYNNILWFMELSYGNIIHIINIYQDLSQYNTNFNYKFFENTINILNENNYIFIFCKEIINLFKNGNNHFILCCNFIKALGMISDNFFNNIPDWLNNISNDNFNFRNRLLDNNRFTFYLNINNQQLFQDYNQNNLVDESTIHYILDLLNRNI